MPEHSAPHSPAHMLGQHSLAGITTLVLRSPERARELVTLISNAGGETVLAPVITREPITSSQRAELDAAVATLHHYQWVGVTSVNAVDELVAAMKRAHPNTPIPQIAATTQWATVGPATTKALLAHNINATFEATENSAAGLLAQWPQATLPTGDIVGKRPEVLLPLGNLATTQLETGLQERGYATTRVTTYLTVPHPAPQEALNLWEDGDIDAVILSSGSIVREFCKQFDPTRTPHHQPLMVAIGQPTMRAASAAGISIDVVAKNATNQGLFDALQRAVALSTEGN